MAQPYCNVSDVLNKPITKVLTDAGWDYSPTSVDVVPLIAESDAEIDSRLGKLGYTLPFVSNPQIVFEMSVAHTRYAILRDVFTGDAPSQAAAASMKANKDHFDELMSGIVSGSASLVDSGGNVVPRSENGVSTASYPDTEGSPLIDAYPSYPAGPYPDKFNPLCDDSEAT